MDIVVEYMATDLTPGENDGVKLGIADLRSLDVGGGVTIRLQNHDIESRCGHYKWGSNHPVIGIKDCSSRGYSDYRWRVNRTPHGVIIHEVGHWIEDEFLSRQVPELFEPRNDITNYSGGSCSENFAESWRVWVSSPEVLKAINEEKYRWFDDRWNNPRDGMLEEHFSTYTKTIQNQIREASTNEHIRRYCKEENIELE